MAKLCNQRVNAAILTTVLFLAPLSALAQSNNRYYSTPDANGDYQVYRAPARINITPQPDNTYYAAPAASGNVAYYDNSNRVPVEARIRSGAREAWANQPAKKAAAGALVGLGAAALKSRNLWHGTLVGLAAGTGFGLVNESRYFSVHPLGRRALKGAIVGVAAASATGAAALLPALGIGAAVGAGIHALNRL